LRKIGRRKRVEGLVALRLGALIGGSDGDCNLGDEEGDDVRRHVFGGERGRHVRSSAVSLAAEIELSGRRIGATGQFDLHQ